MTIDQALEMVKSQHVQQQDAKAQQAKERAEKAKQAAAAQRKKKAKKVWLDPSRIIFQAEVLRESKPDGDDDDLLRVKVRWAPGGWIW